MDSTQRRNGNGWNDQLLLTLTSVLLLLLATWPLWQPGGPFPRIPLLSPAQAWPAAAGRALLTVLLTVLGTGLVFGLAACCRSARPFATRVPAARVAAGLVVGLLMLLVLADQHRLQAWVWHLGLLCGLLALDVSPRVVQRACWLTASIYCWSAWQKVDASYFQTAGPYLLDGLLGCCGLSHAGWPPALRTFAVGLLPAGELAVGLGLLFRRTRRAATAAACLMHALLLLTLGPLGLDHSAGVLLWNASLIGQNLLFWRYFARQRRGHDHSQQPVAGVLSQPARSTGWMQAGAAGVLLLFAILLPLLEPWGLCDSWLAWNLYSSRAAQVQLSVRCELRGDLPAEVRPFVDSAEPGRLWCRLHDDRWSLEATWAPVTPDARYRAGLALAVARLLNRPDGVRMVLQSQPVRRTGRRQHRELYGAEDIRSWLRSRRLNGEPAR